MNIPFEREALLSPITTTPGPKKVGICVSPRIARLGIQNVVVASDGQVAFSIETVEEFFESLEMTADLDLLIIDYLTLNQLDDQHNRLLHRASAVMVIGSNQEDWRLELEHCLQAGAQCYCGPDVDVTQLCAAMNNLFAGGSWFDGNALEVLSELMTTRNPSPSSLPTLTNRETLVLDRMAKGMTNGQIAAELYVSVSTVKSHVRAIFSKLNVKSRAQAAYECVRRGLVEG
jgi:two-component system, NarL family, response regulator LiaR